ncbi:hypothetical protein N2152v2_009537 [Parachlorella kessleri]
MERHLNYQWNFREGDLPPQLPPNHYSVHLHRPYLASPGGPCPTSVNLEGMACDWQPPFTNGALHVQHVVLGGHGAVLTLHWTTVAITVKAAPSGAPAVAQQ